MIRTYISLKKSVALKHRLVHGTSSSAPLFSQFWRELFSQSLFKGQQESVSDHIVVGRLDSLWNVLRAQLLEVLERALEICKCLLNCLENSSPVSFEGNALVQIWLVFKAKQLKGAWSQREDVFEEQYALSGEGWIQGLYLGERGSQRVGSSSKLSDVDSSESDLSAHDLLLHEEGTSLHGGHHWRRSADEIGELRSQELFDC